MEKIYEIIERKRKGIDCTEAESAELKGWLRELKLPSDSDIVSAIQELFPQEYGEFLDESEPETKDKQILINEVIEHIKEDVAMGDFTAIEELLKFCPTESLIAYLPEEQGKRFKTIPEVKKETRIYLVSLQESGLDTEEINSLSDEEFIDEAEKEGFVWSLKGFNLDWNEDTIPTFDTIMRIREVEI